jgi:ubiquinone/menaquinone biosynthesis C-methylase UbiE
MPDYGRIYSERADEYERLILREDYQGNILATLRRVVALEGADVVELAAGTGRLTRLMVPLVRMITAFDAESHMLDRARKILENMAEENWTLDVADFRKIPVPDKIADVVIEGWGLGHLVIWNWERWEEELDLTLSEMKRITRTGGTLLILETLGTGTEVPEAPARELSLLYKRLENYYGFHRECIRTDYKFESLDEAVGLINFFFGEQLAKRTQSLGRRIVPECTGIWRLSLE